MNEIKVLDHGYIKIIESWGSDERIIEAARMSTGKGFNGWGPMLCPKCNGQGMVDGAECKSCDDACHVPGDEKLLRFLWENKHATPFEMAGAVIEVKAPIFVFREWHRHRTQSYNEMSARYIPLPDEDYIPSVERLMLGSGGRNKQAGTIADAATLTTERAGRFREVLAVHYAECAAIYRDALRDGVPKELARVLLPVARYSRMRASTNLRNWLAFEALRSTEKNPNAQWEIRQYADALLDILSERFPRTLALFRNK